VFAHTTHVVAAPHGFACVGIPTTWLYIPSFIEIRSWVSEPKGVKFGLFHYFGYCLLQQLVLPYKQAVISEADGMGWATAPPPAMDKKLKLSCRVTHIDALAVAMALSH